MVRDFTIYIHLSIEIQKLQTKNGNKWPCGFQEVENVKLFDARRSMDEGRRTTTSHLSYSGDLFTRNRIFNRGRKILVIYKNAYVRRYVKNQSKVYV